MILLSFYFVEEENEVLQPSLPKEHISMKRAVPTVLYEYIK